jgi:hypothetical protein
MSETSVKKVYEIYKKRYPEQSDDDARGDGRRGSKNVALLAFRSGLCPILVATSLIEVGLDVKARQFDGDLFAEPFRLIFAPPTAGPDRPGWDSRPVSWPFGQRRRRGERAKLNILLSTEMASRSPKKICAYGAQARLAGSSRAAYRISPTPT